MIVFGLTSIDSALTAEGLNYSRVIIHILFERTPIAAVAFSIGFVLSLWESSKSANYRPFISFLMISFVVFFLFIILKRELSNVESAEEIYGQQSSKVSLSSQSSNYQFPLVLSYISQFADVLSFSIIYKLDSFLPKEVRFLDNPFGIQKNSLQTHQIIHGPLLNMGLRKDLDNYIYDQYVPALIMYENDSLNLTSLRPLWPGHNQIVKYYSLKGKEQWDNIESQLQSMIDTPDSPLRKAKEVLGILSKQDKKDIDHQMISSMIKARFINAHSIWFSEMSGIYSFAPYIYGWANICLYITFPFFLLVFLIVRELGLLFKYLEVFLWIKSWILCQSISYYVSLAGAEVQAQSGPNISWFWDYPYFIYISAILLILIPAFSFLGIHQTFQLMSTNIKEKRNE